MVWNGRKTIIWTSFNFLFCDFVSFLWPISASTIQSLLYLIFWFCFTVRKSWLKQSATNWKAAALWLVPDSKLGILQQFIRKNLKSTLLLVFFLCVYMLLICMPAYRLYRKKWNEITDEKLSFPWDEINFWHIPKVCPF